MKKSILIIEDEAFFRELIKKKLSSDVFDVFEATNGQEGIDEAIEKKPDVILLDLLLPDMSGFDVLSKLKSDLHLSTIPVIILSNLADPQDIQKGLKLGAVAHLIKAQSDINDIVVKIKEILHLS